MIYCMALVARLSWRKLGWVAILAEKGRVGWNGVPGSVFEGQVISRTGCWTGEMTLWLRPLVAFAEPLDSVPRAHIALSHLSLQFQWPQYSLLPSVGIGHICTHT